ncbi:MAG: hypothetical protein A2X99_02615 [Deltaproteobacteria bacterium GWB2_55_19]|nr:MAG: hypothetical protein A2X99_02615 [Deltaproteobacteria bacterium GWB2_55_19]
MNTPSSLPKETALGGLLKTLFTELERSGQSYCVCGNYEGLPEYTSHDVDIWASDVEAFEKILYASAEKNGLTLYLRNRLANGSNNFFYKTSPGIEFVHIDVLSECAWASFVPIVRSARIGEGRVKYRGFFVAEPIVESAMHLLYPLLHAGKVKDKYREKIFSFREEPRFALILEEAVGKDGAGELLAKISRRDWKGIEKNAGRYRLQAVLNSLARDNVRVARAFISFAWTNVARLFSPSGLFMAVMGPDGCGKTTLSNRLLEKFGDCFTSGKLKKFYWRPFLLPRIADLSPFKKKGKPRNGLEDVGLRTVSMSPKARLAYLLKFLYYWADFVAGRLKYQSAWSRGGLVFFDRYYYDHMVYPERFGFSVPKPLMRALGRLIPEPDLKFYLHAPPKRLLERKQELPASEIIRQQEEYRRLIASLKGGYVIDTSRTIEETEQEIMRICASFMAKRLKRGGING